MIGNNTLVSVLAGILILVLIIITIVIRYKGSPSTYDKEQAKDFLNKLSDVFYKKMMEIINNIDFFAYPSIEELEVSVLNDIYDTIWAFVEEELKDAAQKDILTALALKVINKEYVTKFVDQIISSKNINERLAENWKIFHIEKVSEEVEKEDEELQQKYSDPSLYNEDFDVKDLEPVQEVKPTEEELAQLNPQVDTDEVNYDDEDSSVEMIEIIVDKNGRKRNKATGRFVK